MTQLCTAAGEISALLAKKNTKPAAITKVLCKIALMEPFVGRMLPICCGDAKGTFENAVAQQKAWWQILFDHASYMIALSNRATSGVDPVEGIALYEAIQTASLACDEALKQKYQTLADKLSTAYLGSIKDGLKKGWSTRKDFMRAFANVETPETDVFTDGNTGSMPERALKPHGSDPTDSEFSAFGALLGLRKCTEKFFDKTLREQMMELDSTTKIPLGFVTEGYQVFINGQAWQSLKKAWTQTPVKAPELQKPLEVLTAFCAVEFSETLLTEKPYLRVQAHSEWVAENLPDEMEAGWNAYVGRVSTMVDAVVAAAKASCLQEFFAKVSMPFKDWNISEMLGLFENSSEKTNAMDGLRNHFKELLSFISAHASEQVAFTSLYDLYDETVWGKVELKDLDSKLSLENRDLKAAGEMLASFTGAQALVKVLEAGQTRRSLVSKVKKSLGRRPFHSLNKAVSEAFDEELGTA